jgi:hypothetical protein
MAGDQSPAYPGRIKNLAQAEGKATGSGLFLMNQLLKVDSVFHDKHIHAHLRG